MEWKPEYSLGIQEIDDQHRSLVEKFSEIEKLVTGKEAWMRIHYALVELQELAREHFAFEEALMRLFGIPDTGSHKNVHVNFFIKLAEIESRSLRGSAESDLVKFLYDYLRHHILMEDKKDYAVPILAGAEVVRVTSE